MHHVLNKKIISWAVLIIFAAGIFIFSSQNGSQSHRLSGQLVEEIKETKNYVSEEVKGIKERIFPKRADTGDTKENQKAGNNKDTKQLEQKAYWESVKRNYEYDIMLRKFAHFMEYFLLAVLFFTVLSVSKVRQKKALTITLFFCILFAAIDEFHQNFIPGRTGLVRDAMIDSAGSTLAVILLFFVTSIFKRFNGSNKHEVP